MNPYTGVDFWQFIGLFCQRFFGLITFQIEPCSDEIQIGMLALIGLSSALIGAFLMLKKMVMVANSLSHTILLGIIVAFLLVGTQKLQVGHEFGHFNLTILMIASAISALVTTFLTQLLTRWGKVQEDAGIGLVFTTLFALGILLVTLFTRNLHLGLEVVMGNVDLVEAQDLQLALWQVLLSLAFVLVFFKPLKACAFDPIFAKLSGLRPALVEFLLLFLTATLAVVAFRAVGVLLFLTFLTGPCLITRIFTYRIKTIIIGGASIAVLCSFIGVAISRHLLTKYHLPLSTGALVVTLLLVLYLSCILWKTRGRMVELRKKSN